MNPNIFKKVIIALFSSAVVIFTFNFLMFLYLSYEYHSVVHAIHRGDFIGLSLLVFFIGLAPSILTIVFLECRRQKNSKVYVKNCVLFASLWVALLYIWFDFVLPFWETHSVVENDDNLRNFGVISRNPEPSISIKRTFVFTLLYSILISFGFCKLYCYLIKKLKVCDD